MSDQTRQGVHPPVGSGREQYRGNPAAPSSPDTLTVTLKEAFDSFFEDVELLGRAFAKDDVDLLKAAAASVSQRSVSFRVRLLAALPSAPDYRLRDATDEIADIFNEEVLRGAQTSRLVVLSLRDTVLARLAVLSEATTDPDLDVDARLLRDARDALLTAANILDANPTEDTCRHGNGVDECEEPEGCADRSRRETITDVARRITAHLSASQPPEPDIQ